MARGQANMLHRAAGRWASPSHSCLFRDVGFCLRGCPPGRDRLIARFGADAAKPAYRMAHGRERGREQSVDWRKRFEWSFGSRVACARRSIKTVDLEIRPLARGSAPLRGSGHHWGPSIEEKGSNG